MTTVSRAILATALLFGVTSVAVSARQAAPPAPAADTPQMAETVFKNIRVLRGIPVDEFIDTMGMFAAATAKDCTGCHSAEILDGKPDAFAINTPMIEKARSMVSMVNAMNKTYFNNQKRLSCATCHSNTSSPENVPNMSIQYGDPVENADSMQFIVASGSNPSQIDGVFAKWIEALGGEERLAAATSYTATGTYAGWDTGLSPVPMDIYAKAPGQLSLVTHRTEGDSVWTSDGRNGWRVAVNSATPFTIPLTGGNLAEIQLEALVALEPTRVRLAYAKWEISKSVIDDKPVQILRGTNAGQTPVNFYFDNTGLLVRMLRWNDTAVGLVATRYDYTDYRDIGGVKRPYGWVKTSTINQVTVVLKEIRPNVAIDAARFARPTTTRLIR